MPLPPELEASLLREIIAIYRWKNELHFGSRLRLPVFALVDGVSRLGCWKRASRQLELSRALVVERPWPEVVEVLLHEMAHQFVHEVLGVIDETAHGPVFQRTCAQRGIDARAAGLAEGRAADPVTARILEKVQRLLALAGSSERHEAEAAMRKAHELMLKHNIDGAVTGRDYVVAHLGDPTKRRTSVERDIVVLLTEYFFVEVIEIPVYVASSGGRGHVFEVCGTEANVRMAEHVFGFLGGTAERLWQQARRTHGFPGGERVPYQTGVVRGFREKLADERSLLRGTGLVWVKDAALRDFYEARHPRVHRSSRTTRVSEGHAQGRSDGRSVVLHKPVSSGASEGAPRRLGSGG